MGSPPFVISLKNVMDFGGDLIVVLAKKREEKVH
jgi:hypothetical protein